MSSKQIQGSSFVLIFESPGGLVQIQFAYGLKLSDDAIDTVTNEEMISPVDFDCKPIPETPCEKPSQRKSSAASVDATRAYPISRKYLALPLDPSVREKAYPLFAYNKFAAYRNYIGYMA